MQSFCRTHRDTQPCSQQKRESLEEVRNSGEETAPEIGTLLFDVHLSKLFKELIRFPESQVVLFWKQRPINVFSAMDDQDCRVELFLFCGQNKMSLHKQSCPHLCPHVRAHSQTRTLTGVAREVAPESSESFLSERFSPLVRRARMFIPSTHTHLLNGFGKITGKLLSIAF